MIVRLLGSALIIAALVAGAYEIVDWLRAGDYHALSAGQLWFDIHRPSLDSTRSGIRSFAPWLWDSVMRWILQRPVWLVLGVPGLFLLWLARRRARRRQGVFHKGS